VLLELSTVIDNKRSFFQIKKFGDEYFTFLTKCKNPKACTILLRGASKDVLMEVERNLQDAMNVARNVMIDPYLVSLNMFYSAYFNFASS
jgi:T-complex protein 1 subunit gamma